MTCKLISIKLVLLGLWLMASSMDAASGGTDTLFRSDEVVNLQIRTNFTEILAGRTKEPEEYEALLIILNGDGSGNRLSVKVSSRGNFRRDPGNCSFPPLKIDFRKKETFNTLFQGQDELKLVTPCRDDVDVLEEYLIYQLYSRVTDQSLKVRLARVEYFDTEKNKKVLEGYSFFLEDEDHAARRMDAVETHKFVTPFDLDVESFSQLAVFQFMIGNKDWYVTSRKNIIVMQPSDTTKLPFAVPYDFDFAGFVDADYTRPKNIAVTSLATRRIFKGICNAEESVFKALNLCRELRTEFENLIAGMKLIPRYNREREQRYLDEFFLLIEDNRQVRKNFIETCETRSLYNLSSQADEP